MIIFSDEHEVIETGRLTNAAILKTQVAASILSLVQYNLYSHHLQIEGGFSIVKNVL